MSIDSPNRVALEKYLSRVPGNKKTMFKCPGCGGLIGTLKPAPGESPFTSACTCPDCDKQLFKTVRSSGIVSVKELA